jgi:hypothetical protein
MVAPFSGCPGGASGLFKWAGAQARPLYIIGIRYPYPIFMEKPMPIRFNPKCVDAFTPTQTRGQHEQRDRHKIQFENKRKER